jgi:phosphoribosyl-AMP cyclohydrolase
MDIEKLKFDEKGLIPVIAQDYKDGTVLMMAYMNKESFEKTLETREMWYWSRSRKVLWHKGETSGHIQKVKELYYDCDADTLLARIEQVGDIACHTGKRSCFFNKII